MVKVYVAGQWSDRARISEYIQACREIPGVQISFDWTQNEWKAPENSAEASKYAQLDLNGVREADIVVALIVDPTYAYRGTFTELGCALGLEKQVFIVCPLKKAEAHTNIFYWHPNITHMSEWSLFFNHLSEVSTKQISKQFVSENKNETATLTELLKEDEMDEIGELDIDWNSFMRHEKGVQEISRSRMATELNTNTNQNVDSYTLEQYKHDMLNYVKQTYRQ